MEFLINGPMPNGYTTASRAWVSEVLLGFDNGGNSRTQMLNVGILFFDNPRMNLWTAMVQGLGSVTNRNGLALLQEVINGKKNVFFGGGTPDTVDANLRGGDLGSRRLHRNVSSAATSSSTPDFFRNY